LLQRRERILFCRKAWSLSSSYRNLSDRYCDCSDMLLKRDIFTSNRNLRIGANS